MLCLCAGEGVCAKTGYLWAGVVVCAKMLCLWALFSGYERFSYDMCEMRLFTCAILFLCANEATDPLICANGHHRSPPPRSSAAAQQPLHIHPSQNKKRVDRIDSFSTFPDV
jgi:hypothetical protein